MSDRINEAKAITTDVFGEDDLIRRTDAVEALAEWGISPLVLMPVPSAQPEQKWIPVTDRLPDDEKRVLCTVQSGEYFTVVPGIFIQCTRRWFPEVYGNHDNVLAWMPLPEPYKGGDQISANTIYKFNQ